MRRLRVIGLTGSIGMGKSTAAAMLQRLGLPIFDADATVHRLFARGGAAVAPVEAAFPGVVVDGAVNRAALGPRVFGNPEALRRLERIVHPLVGQAERAFLRRAGLQRRRLAVRDVPLLFETGGNRRCDATIVVSAPAHVQAQRVLRRPGMTMERLNQVRRQQMPDAQKRRRADFVVPTGLGKRATWTRLSAIVSRLRAHPPIRHDRALRR